MLPAALVEAARDELAGERPDTRAERRLLEFEPLATGDDPVSVELPAEFLAVRAASDQAGLEEALGDHGAVVRLDGLDGSTRAAAIARSRGFVGAYGAEAILAVLLGVPSVVLGHVDDGDRRLVSSFLDRPPYGPLHVIESGGSAADAAGRAERLLETPLEAVAGV